MSSTFPSPNNCFYPVAHNSSYGYYTKVKDSTQKLTFNYGDVFNEYTNADANISCSGERTCYVGCTCKDGWNGKKNITSSGSSLTTASAGADLSSNYTIADSGSVAKTTTSASGVSISTMATGDNCTISVTDPRYGVTCTKPSTYDCAGVCGGGAYFECPNNYNYAKDSCKKNQSSAYKQCNGNTSIKDTSSLCYSIGEAKTCSDEGYVSSCPSGQSGTQVTSPCGNTCYTDCKADCQYYISKASRPETQIPSNATIVILVDGKHYDGGAASEFSGTSFTMSSSVSMGVTDMGLIVVADGKFVGKSTGGDVVARADQNWPCGTVFKMILSKDAPKVECADGYYQDKIPDGYTCDEVIFDDQKCYTDCKKNEQKYTVTVNFTARANSLEHPGDCHYVQSHTPYVEITLNGQTKSAVASTGSVTFTNVPPGTYTISMSAQIGVTGVSTAGSDGKCRTSEEAVSTENILTQSKTIKVNNNTSTSMAVHCCMADPSIIL